MWGRGALEPSAVTHLRALPLICVDLRQRGEGGAGGVSKHFELTIHVLDPSLLIQGGGGGVGLGLVGCFGG